MSIIDEQGAKAISNWFKDKKDTPHTITIDKLKLELRDDRELATLQLILMRNNVKYKIDEFSQN
jgi:hypothetical protein